MKKNEKRLLEKYAKIFKKGTIKESAIISLKSLLMNQNYTDTLKEKLTDLLYSHINKKNGLKITQEQTEKGLNFLKKSLYTKKGKKRDTTKTQYLSDKFYNIVDNFKSFKFYGYYTYDTNIYIERDLLTPIYSIESTNNKTIGYIYINNILKEF